MTYGLASGSAQKAIYGGRMSMADVATDAFGNALGHHIATTINPNGYYAPASNRSEPPLTPIIDEMQANGLLNGYSEAHSDVTSKMMVYDSLTSYRGGDPTQNDGDLGILFPQRDRPQKSC